MAELQSTPGNDVIVGTSGDDLIDAGEGSDTIYGLGGNDALFGWNGNDIIDGGDGDDWIFGEGGTDTLTGGAGNDIFGEFDQWLDGDTITDFSIGDIILIRDADISTFTFSLNGSTLTFSGAPTPAFTGGSIILLGAAGAVFAASAHAEGGVQIIMTARPDAKNDFNGDGRSDILFRHDTGLVTNSLGTANGGFSNNFANVASAVGNDWEIAGTGDFDGDGRDDLLWRHDSGVVSEWLGTANGGFADNFANAGANVATSWRIVGTGDFNGDGRDDILFRHDSGIVTNWLGEADGGFAPNFANASSSVDASWKVIGTGDFNGDGKDDILFRHDSGLITEWLGTANGGFADNFANSASSVATSWHVAGIGDFNGDNRDDLLWRNDSGLVTDWLANANGSFKTNGANFMSQVGTDWSVSDIGDYNGDGRDDILWRHSSGLVTNWLGQLNGSFGDNIPNAATSVASSWHVQSVDLLWL